MIHIFDSEDDGYSHNRCSYCSYCKKKPGFILRIGFESNLKPFQRIAKEECIVNICESCLLKKAERYITREGRSMKVNKDGSWDAL